MLYGFDGYWNWKEGMASEIKPISKISKDSNSPYFLLQKMSFDSVLDFDLLQHGSSSAHKFNYMAVITKGQRNVQFHLEMYQLDTRADKYDSQGMFWNY